MKLYVRIIYKDDEKEDFECDDFPGIGDWVTIYKKDFKRIVIPKEGIKRIEYTDEKSKFL